MPLVPQKVWSLWCNSCLVQVDMRDKALECSQQSLSRRRLQEVVHQALVLVKEPKKAGFHIQIGLTGNLLRGPGLSQATRKVSET